MADLINVICRKLFDCAGVWTNNIYSFLVEHKELALQGSMLFAAWEMDFVVSLDQLQTVDQNKLRKEMWFYFALSLHFPTQWIMTQGVDDFSGKRNKLLPPSAMQ